MRVLFLCDILIILLRSALFLHLMRTVLVREVGKKDAECSNCAQAKRKVCPKAYVIRRRAQFGQSKRNTKEEKPYRAFQHLKINLHNRIYYLLIPIPFAVCAFFTPHQG